MCYNKKFPRGKLLHWGSDVVRWDKWAHMCTMRRRNSAGTGCKKRELQRKQERATDDRAQDIKLFPSSWWINDVRRRRSNKLNSIFFFFHPQWGIRFSGKVEYLFNFQTSFQEREDIRRKRRRRRRRRKERYFWEIILCRFFKKRKKRSQSRALGAVNVTLKSYDQTLTIKPHWD